MQILSTIRSADAGRRILTILAGAMILVTGCRDGTTAPGLYTQSPPGKDLVDGANGGHGGFYFLPPMVRLPAYSGQTDPNQSPTVVVCALVTTTGAKRCGDIVAAFSLGQGTGSEVLRYDAAAQQYVVNWKTDQCLSGACVLSSTVTYRLRVLIGSSELGHADMVFLNNGSQAKNAQTGDVTALVNGRTLPVKFRIEKGAVNLAAPGASTAIASAGGTIATNDGQVTLEFSPGALPSSTNITVSPAANVPPGPGAWSPPIELGPDGTTFSAPVTLTLGVDPSKLPPGIPMSALRLFTRTGDGWTEVPGSVVNESDNTVSASIQHFSSYTVMYAPNVITASGTPNTLVVGQTALVADFIYAYVTTPYTICYTARYWTSWFFGGYWTYYTNCFTNVSTSSYPARGYGVTWSSSNAQVLGFPNPVSYTDQDGRASAPLNALRPGTSIISATTYGGTSPTLSVTSLGKLGILPHTADLVAGWSLGLRLTQTVATPNDVTVSLTSKNTLQIGEPGTGNYTYGGQTGSYVIAANATQKVLNMFELSGPNTDTLIASAPGYVPDTAVINFVKGKILIAGWPATLSFGDSVPLTLTAGDQNGAPVANFAYPVTFAFHHTTGLAFSNGHSAIESIEVPQRTSSTFWLKAVGIGAQQVTITSRDYDPYTNDITPGGAVIDPFPQAGFQLNVSGVAGTHVTADVPINNAGTGALRNMRISGTVNNCYNGSLITWVHATFTEGVVPVIMHLTLDPPLTYPGGQYDFCYGLSADAAPDRSYGVRLTLTAAFSLRSGSVSNGDDHTCGLTPAGEAYCWGVNVYGQVGVGTSGGVFNRPTKVTGNHTFTQMAVGSISACALELDGRVFCWGANNVNSLGDGLDASVESERAFPAPVQSALQFTQLVYGGGTPCALDVNAKAWCWGWDDNDRLGNGNGPGAMASSPVPVAVLGNRSYRFLASGEVSTCGVTTASETYCWGVLLGTGANPVAGGHVFTALSLGQFHACGLDAGGSTWCWGWNGEGELGDGSVFSGNTFTPVHAALGLTFVSIASTLQGNCGLTSAGAVYCWGVNSLGQLGNGTTTPSATPVRVSGSLNFTSISGNYYSYCANATDGHTYCWGDNGNAQLGDGTFTSHSVPTAVVNPVP
jgi:alpha-tubulin suppressor-like RCC1 family protein